MPYRPSRAAVWLYAGCAVAGLAIAFGAWRHVYLAASPLAISGLFLRWVVIGVATAESIRRRSLTACIFAGMLVGGALGHDWAGAALHIQVLRDIFMRLIKTIIAPLIFSTLVVGIAGHSDMKKVGRMGIKAIVYFEVVTTFALVIGLAAANLTHAGEGMNLTAAPAQTAPAGASMPTASKLILDAFPENIAKSIVDGQVLQIVVFTLIFAIALALVSESKRQPMLSFCNSLAEVMFKFTNIVMWFAPFGVAGAIGAIVAQSGGKILGNLAILLATLYGALLVFLVGVLWPIALLARIPVRRFLRAIAEPVTIAFATASSEAALPRAMEEMEAMGVPRETVAFVIPTGYSLNLDGSTLYQSLASLFVAQAAGIHLTLGQQVMLMLTIMLASKGTAGVARASLVILLAIAIQFKLPPEPIFVLMGIDQLMDMARSSTNVIGNCLASAVIARWEGEFPSATQSAAVAEATPS
jgi:Na+/H+-dicarboxylate symporter